MKKRVAPPLEDLYGAELDEDIDLSDISEPEDARLRHPPTISVQPHLAEDEEYLEEEEEEEEDEEAAAKHEQAIADRVKASQAAMRDLLSSFSQDHLHRYEIFRRHGFKKETIKRLIQKVYDQHSGGINPNCTIVVSGVAKVFVGELIELARSIMDSAGESGPITPFFILEAHRRMQAIDPLTLRAPYHSSLFRS